MFVGYFFDMRIGNFARKNILDILMDGEQKTLFDMSLKLSDNVEYLRKVLNNLVEEGCVSKKGYSYQITETGRDVYKTIIRQ